MANHTKPTAPRCRAAVALVGETWIVADNLGVRIKDFALDLAQDLIVLKHYPAAAPWASANTSAATAGADIRVHLRKLSACVIAKAHWIGKNLPDTVN